MVLPSIVRPWRLARQRSAEVTYSDTLLALQPGAKHHLIPWRSIHSMSMWSVPMVAVPTNFTELPPSRDSFAIVVDRIARTSASRTSAGAILRPSLTMASPKVEKASFTYGMFEQQTIFIILAFL